MTKQLFIFAALLASSLSLASIGSGQDLDVAEFAKRIAEFHRIRRAVPVPVSEPQAPSGIRKFELDPSTKRFDPQSYFELFTHLQTDPGMVLDWVYELDDLGGVPILYCRKADAANFANIDQFTAAISEEAGLKEVNKIWEEWRRKSSRTGPIDPFAPLSGPALKKLEKERDAKLEKYPRREYWDWWRESIRTDGSDQGYLELAAVYMLAGQFALYWHANYNDVVIIPDKAALRILVKTPIYEFSEPKKFLPTDIADQALMLNPTPTVKREENSITVTFLTFSQFSGFQRSAIKLSKAVPDRVEEFTESTEVEFHSGMTY